MGYTADDIKQVIHDASPGLTDRKKDRFEYYFDRTVDRVFNDPDVRKSIEQRLQKGRGPEIGF